MPAASRPEDRVIVVGAGLAGLATALRLAPLPVLLVTPALLGEDAATPYAQGGIAAALGEDDSPALHADDTVAAGAGLTDPAVATDMAGEAARAIAWAEEMGAAFDRDGSGRLALGREAAHSRWRIVHAGGDRTGAVLHAALARRARLTPSITILEGHAASNLLRDAQGRIRGVALTRVADGAIAVLPARAVVLATGGIGGLWAATTNPLSATGTGLVLAARVGAVLRDVEFVQFHPTAIAAGPAGLARLPLASEALRGEGAILVDETGHRFALDLPGAELAPRDAVARRIAQHIGAGHKVFLDARPALGDRFPERFPGIHALCMNAGVDPCREAIPVRPAAHYHMGGVETGTTGATSLPGLWACGEVAATGLHGANRLASNSLLEALVVAGRVARDIAGSAAVPPAPIPVPPPASHPMDDPVSRDDLRRLMDEHVGASRDGEGLAAALDVLMDASRAPGRLGAFGTACLLVAGAAFARRESRGAHWRRDHPQAAPTALSSRLTLADVMAIAADATGRAPAPDHAARRQAR